MYGNPLLSSSQIPLNFISFLEFIELNIRVIHNQVIKRLTIFIVSEVYTNIPSLHNIFTGHMRFSVFASSVIIDGLKEFNLHPESINSVRRVEYAQEILVKIHRPKLSIQFSVSFEGIAHKISLPIFLVHYHDAIKKHTKCTT